MGTDINLWVERDNKPLDDWRFYFSADENFIWRDYEVWRTLCKDVRPINKPYRSIGPARGLPNNLAKYTSNNIFDYQVNKGKKLHHISWISDEEARDWFPWEYNPTQMSHFAVVLWTYLWRNDFTYRFIFGFDN